MNVTHTHTCGRGSGQGDVRAHMATEGAPVEKAPEAELASVLLHGGSQRTIERKNTRTVRGYISHTSRFTT